MNKFNLVITKMPDDTLMVKEQEKPRMLRESLLSLRSTIDAKKQEHADAVAKASEDAADSIQQPDVSHELELIE